MKDIGLPTQQSGDELVWHSGMAMAYTVPNELANWVARVILADVAAGAIGRTNNFRPAGLVKTGSALE